MSHLDVPELVHRLNELGLTLTVTAMSNGRLRLNQWRTARFFENEAEVEKIWSEMVRDRPGTLLEIARYLAASPPLAPEAGSGEPQD